MSETPLPVKLTKRQEWTGARLEKRRKIDRDAQRAVRERTKNRIQELQSTIDSLLQNQGDERVENLTRQLREQREENVRLKKFLGGLGKMIQGAVSTEDGLENEKVVENGEGSPATSGGSEVVEVPRRNVLEFHGGGMLNGTPPPPQQQQHDLIYLPGALGSASNHVDSAIPPVAPGPKPIWETVDESLSKAQSLIIRTPVQTAEQDADIIIRAVLHGWAVVDQHHNLDDGWRILRYIDETIWYICGLVERMAILRVMRLTMLRDMNAHQTFADIPAYMALRPTQTIIKHSKIIDYMVWPELRDNLILLPNKRHPSVLSRLIPANIRFCWPYTLDSIYTTSPNTHNASTGYDFSDAFDVRFQDIQNWTLSSDFFVECPDLIGVVAISNPGPRGLGHNMTRIWDAHSPVHLDGSVALMQIHGLQNDILPNGHGHGHGSGGQLAEEREDMDGNVDGMTDVNADSISMGEFTSEELMGVQSDDMNWGHIFSGQGG